MNEKNLLDDITSKSLKQLTLCDYLLHIVYDEHIAIPYANNPNKQVSYN